MTPAVDIEHLTRRYGALEALADISLTVSEGEIFGLIGPDGAGKSTLYRILATIMRPTSGTARVFGMDTVSHYADIRRITGYMPERFSLYPYLTVKENLDFFASLFGVKVSENFDLIAPVFSQLAKFPDRPAGQLSGGMKQKLALSCALIHKPRILLLDEPTTGVDTVSRSEFWNILGSLRSQGITILVSTSYMDEATRCDRIAMIDRGRIFRTDTPAALVTGIGETIYDAVAHDMFALLTELRRLPEVARCYTFGATLHVVAGPGFNPAEAETELKKRGIADARITPATPDIEDLFIKLTLDDDDKYNDNNN